MFRSKENLPEERSRMVNLQLRARGIRSEAVLRVMGTVPRERFLPPGRSREAYRDQALPIAHGQTISQPYMVAVMTEALDLCGNDRALEIGTGSGYQTAVLSRLTSKVWSIERIPGLLEEARRILGVGNVRFRLGDGTLGWPEEAPFDAIVVTAGSPGIPEALKEQLAPEGGRLVIPVGDRALQNLVRVTRKGDHFLEETLLACRFVPLVGA
ncbi:MAG: protein-L-isoaspartate(D-aspartate) O-methyltransferase, partial [Longimicrobiales bacterium]